MDYCREMVNSVVQTLREMLKNYTNEYKRLPKGSLTCNYNMGRNRYYHARKVNGKYVRTSINALEIQGKETLKQLARKEFLRQNIARIQKNIATLETAMRKYERLDSSQVINDMKRAYRMLESSWFFNEDALQTRRKLVSCIKSGVGDLNFDEYQPMETSRILLHRPWMEAPFERNPYPFGNEEIYTSDGTRARSKAEAMIYESLKKYNVPFKYDPLLTATDSDGVPFDFAPDYAFEDADFEEFYWEFCGMMDEPKYVKRYYEKRSAYEKAGIVPWKNIIYSFAAGNDIDMGYIESVIHYQIIPRL